MPKANTPSSAMDSDARTVKSAAVNSPAVRKALMYSGDCHPNKVYKNTRGKGLVAAILLAAFCNEA